MDLNLGLLDFVVIQGVLPLHSKVLNLLMQRLTFVQYLGILQIIVEHVSQLRGVLCPGIQVSKYLEGNLECLMQYHGIFLPLDL